jgi:hypothetical protein
MFFPETFIQKNKTKSLKMENQKNNQKPLKSQQTIKKL